MKSLFKCIMYGIAFSVPSVLSAQVKQAAYPKDYFRNPLDIPIFLAGNFGECRPGHFHSGIDIKTKGKENERVHAAADGYVSRIKMEKGGFGHGLYITHPNGYTTLYAHLNDFAPAIQRFVRQQQYAKQRWDVDLLLKPDQFRVSKGDLIAWSGNTGASTAPHLHFEIRNTETEHPLNPELFGLPIIDHVQPVLRQVAIYQGNIYKTRPLVLGLKKVGDSYKPVFPSSVTATADTLILSLRAPLGIGINADDYMDGSDNSLTFLTADLRLDNNLQAQVTLDNIGYDETRYIHAYTDYKTRTVDRSWIQCLFQLPGNKLNTIYTSLNAAKGWLTIKDDMTHKVDILLTDDNGNTCSTSFFVRLPVKDQPATDTAELTPVKEFFVNKTNTWQDNNIAFSLDQSQLYDDFTFSFGHYPAPGMYSEKFELRHIYVPVHHYFDLRIKPDRPVPFDLRSKMVLMHFDGKDEEGKAAKQDDNGWYKASVRELGTYWLDVDTVAPVIKPSFKNATALTKAKQILFTVKDATTSVKIFNGYIDDKWVCFEQHGTSFFYKFDEHCSKGKHKLVFNAEDENGNAATYTINFTR